LLTSVSMTDYALWDLIVAGAMLGLAIRWVLGVNIQPQWAAGVGVAVMLLQPWTMSFGVFFSSTSLPSLFFGGGVAAAVFAAIQSINSH
jgi:hypothetical protein